MISSAILKELDDHCVVSFDVFDTLVRRCVDKPVNVFSIVENRYLLNGGNGIPIQDFKKVRVEAEQLIRKQFGEATLDAIYSNIADKHRNCNIELYKRLEIETELDLCVANKEIKEIYEYCEKKGKRIIIITDMYLPKHVIVNILDKAGYTNYSKIYLSCEIGKTKTEGNLFQFVLDEENISPLDILHIGDNISSDIKSAKRYGIKTYWVRNETKRKTCIIKDAENEVLSNFVSKTSQSSFDIFEKVGYECFGPLLYGFINWIKKEVKQKHVDKIVFLSRDGYIMKNVYDKLANSSDIPSVYMFASRRALQGAAICTNASFEDIINSMFIPRHISVSWLVKRWGIDPDLCEREFRELSIDKNTILDGSDLCSNDKIKDLFLSLRSRIVENSEQEYEAFLSYINKMGISGKIAIVDIGWNGNMQNSLEILFNKAGINVDLCGFYLGIVPKSIYQDIYDMNGYLFQKEKNVDLFYDFKYMNSLMELFFMAPHGSCKRYIQTDNDNMVEFDEFEFENTYTYSNVQKLQNAALKFIDEIKNFDTYLGENELSYVNYIYSEFMRPTKLVAKSFGEMEIWDDRWIKIAPKCHSSNIAKITSEFLNSPWKMGYLKRAIVIPIRYDKLIKFLRKYKKFVHS